VRTLLPPAAVRRVEPLAARVRTSTAFRAYLRFKARRGTRLAAAMTYAAFLSIFPLLVVALAIATAALGHSGVQTVNEHIDQTLPGLTGRFSLDDLAANAATVGVVSGLVLVWSGLSWVNTARGSIRTIWAIDDMPAGFAVRRALDLVSLVGLGVTLAVVAAASTLTSGFAVTVLRWLDIDDTDAARAVLEGLGAVLSVLLQTAMFAYLLAGIPRLHMPRGVLLRTSLVAAVVFELTKGLVTSYLTHVASNSVYGAFGAPIAILVWFNLTFQMVLALAAWTATRTEDELARRGRPTAGAGSERPDPELLPDVGGARGRR
jgi:membrane protein